MKTEKVKKLKEKRRKEKKKFQKEKRKTDIHCRLRDLEGQQQAPRGGDTKAHLPPNTSPTNPLLATLVDQTRLTLALCVTEQL